MPKNIIITGASSGIGAATAQRLWQDGHTIFLVARSGDKLHELSARLGERVHVIVADVTDYSQMKAMADQVLALGGSIDVLVNNAGLGVFDPVDQGRIEDWHLMIDVNVKGLLNALHACLPHLIASRGHVLNIGSIASHQVFANSGVYSATKHAVLAISESLHLELATKIRVTTISPGSTNTPFIDQTHNEKLLADYKDYFAAGLSPELVADQIAWAVASPAQSVISEIILRPSRNVK